MAIEVQKGRGLTKEQAIVEAASNGLWVSVQSSDDSDPEDAHWHKWDTHLYLLEGEFQNMDPDNPEFVLEPGDYCVVQKNTLHGGRATKPSVFVVGVTSEILEGQTIHEDLNELN